MNKLAETSVKVSIIHDQRVHRGPCTDPTTGGLKATPCLVIISSFGAI